MHYITDDELESLPISSLEQRKQELEEDLAIQQRLFAAQKQSIIEKIHIQTNWFKRRFNPSPEGPFGSALDEFDVELDAAEDITQLTGVIIKHIKQLSELEKLHKVKEANSLATRLDILFTDLGAKGIIPRSYIIEIQPLIIDELAKIRKDFVEKSPDVPTKAQLDVMDDLKIDLVVSQSEVDASRAVESAIVNANNLISSNRDTGIKSLITAPIYAVQSAVGWVSNQFLLQKLKEFKGRISKKNYLSKPDSLKTDFSGLKGAILLIASNVADRKLEFKQRKEFFLADHQEMFATILNFKFKEKPTLPSIIEFISMQETVFNKLKNDIDLDNEQTALKVLKVRYADFWGNLADETASKAYDIQARFPEDWRVLHKEVLKARSELQKIGRLTPTFAQDKRHMLIECFDECVKKAYKRSFLPRSETRNTQLQDLRATLCKATSPEAASLAIFEKLTEIEQQHRVTSIWYNFVPLKKEWKQSRAASALRDLTTQCQIAGLLPTPAERPPTALTPIIEEFSKAVDTFFDKDILYSNRVHRYHATELLHFLQGIDNGLRQGSISQINALQAAVNHIEDAVTNVEILEQPRGIAWFISGLYNPNKMYNLSTFLTTAKSNLIDRAVLPVSYLHTTYPKIRAVLEPAIISYRKDQSTFAYWASKVPFVGGVLSEDREKGAAEAFEILASLRTVSDSHHATLKLEAALDLLPKTGLPALEKCISESIEPLRLDGTLSGMKRSEISRTLEELNNDFHDIANIMKKMTGGFLLPKRFGNFSKPPEPRQTKSHTQAAYPGK